MESLHVSSPRFMGRATRRTGASWPQIPPGDTA
jgi:hypothetical protein